jgi:asparagine synthase (glutamine-hydrolysing)
MCGIAGIVHFNEVPVAATLIKTMTDCMAHRGPDADGFFVEGGVGLGHRRLSIIDLSEAANQPFSDNSSRYRLIFNGEMYNYESVKPLLPEYDFRTTSDTEVILAAYIKWGPDCLQYFRGMFTIVIWDREQKEIFLARDRMGVKPLYYYLDKEMLIFASETRAMMETGLIKRKINRQALRDYFSFQSVAYPLSLIEGIQQLKAGSWMRISKGKTEIQTYWNVTDNAVDFDFGNKEKVQCRIKELLLQSVSRRLVSDVPVGAFLSGGIDSSIVVGLMAEAGKGRPNSFNISFDEQEYDESRYAELVAKKFNTHHTKIHLKPTSFLEELEHALDAMDTPSGDGINTYVVSKAIHEKGMKVALSGIGGDELFAGYPYFNQYLQLQQKSWLWKLPAAVRRFAAINAGDKKERVQQLLEADSPFINNAYPVFRQILSPQLLERLTSLDAGDGTSSLQHELDAQKAGLKRLPLLSQVSAAEYMGYTQHTLLKDADQMSMAFSLEIREPFFDHDLVEFVLAVPDKWKDPVYPKSLLVESVKSLLPDEVVYRKKQGFLFPWEVWIRHDLHAFCDQHIRNICKRPFIKAKPLQAYWQNFLRGSKQTRWPEIWLFVVLDYWLEKNHVE